MPATVAKGAPVASVVAVRRGKNAHLHGSSVAAKPPTKKATSAVASSQPRSKVGLVSSRKPVKASPPATMKFGNSQQQQRLQAGLVPPQLPFSPSKSGTKALADLIQTNEEAANSNNPWIATAMSLKSFELKRRAASAAASSASSCEAFSFSESYVYQGQHPHGETGLGTSKCPHRQLLRKEVNRSGCWHCPSDTCLCEPFSQAMDEALAEVRAGSNIARQTEGGPGHKDLCAKSLLPPFIARVIRELNITKDDVFFDFGHGNGSVLFQVALETGARCVGVEINAHNAELSRLAWARIQPKLLQLRGSGGAAAAPFPSVELFTGDVAEYMSTKQDSHFDRILAELQNHPAGPRGPVILCSNKLWPRALTGFVEERCRALPVGTRIFCMDDFFPHSRRCDPEAAQLFQLRDYIWPVGVTEWAPMLEGEFYLHTKIKNRADL